MFSVPPQKILFYWQAQKSQARCPLIALVTSAADDLENVSANI